MLSNHSSSCSPYSPFITFVVITCYSAANANPTNIITTTINVEITVIIVSAATTNVTTIHNFTSIISITSTFHAIDNISTTQTEATIITTTANAAPVIISIQDTNTGNPNYKGNFSQPWNRSLFFLYT